MYKKESLTLASDVYSFGMICYLLFEVSEPFAELEPEEAAKAALEGKRPVWSKTNIMGQTVPASVKEVRTNKSSISSDLDPIFTSAPSLRLFHHAGIHHHHFGKTCHLSSHRCRRSALH